MHLVQIDLGQRHLVGRVVEVIFEQLEIAFVDFPHQMHRQVVEVILDRMQALGSVALAFVEAGDVLQHDGMFRRDVVQNDLHAIVEFLGEEDVVVSPAVHDEGRDMARHRRPVDVRLHRFLEADGVAGEQQEAPEAGDLVELLLAVVAADLDPGLLVRDWTRQNRTWFAAVQLEKRMMFIILTLIVAVAAFNLVSTLVMTVTDKRADIAILRTLGASPKSIMGIFVVQGAMVGVIGTAVGLLLGLGIAFNIDVIVPAIEKALNASFLPKDIYLISKMPSEPQSSDIMPIGIISLVLAFVATLYPSWRASRVNPAEALRYE